MTEAWFPFQITGAVAVGVMLGVLAAYLRWRPIRTVAVAAVGYVALWHVVGWWMVGLPETFTKLVVGSLWVLPGAVIYFAIPLVGAFGLGHAIGKRWRSKRSGLTSRRAP